MERPKEVQMYLQHQRKVFILQYVKEFNAVTETLQQAKIPKSTFHKWEKVFDKDGPEGLIRQHSIACTHPKKIKESVVDKVLHLRKEHQLGSWRIKCYLERYHDISISESRVFRILKRYGVERLQKKCARRSLHPKRYSKLVPRHHVQVDVKVLIGKDLKEKPFKRFPYTAMDDATRIRALHIYNQRNQLNP